MLSGTFHAGEPSPAPLCILKDTYHTYPALITWHCATIKPWQWSSKRSPGHCKVMEHAGKRAIHAFFFFFFFKIKFPGQRHTQGEMVGMVCLRHCRQWGNTLSIENSKTIKLTKKSIDFLLSSCPVPNNLSNKTLPLKNIIRWSKF